MVKNLPVIGITMGDPAGIGPEITARALADPSVYRICRPIVIGDAGVMERALSVSGTSLNINPVTEIEAGHFQAGLMDVFDLANVDLSRLEFGKVSAMAGNAAFQAVHKTIELALQKKLDATVTGPIQKEALNLAGHHFSGHTEIYAHFTRTTRYAMLLVHKNMRVIHVSTHVSLRKACELVKKERILEVIALLNDACIQFGISHPRMGVAGLNPHAGDNGLFGNEEQQEILPAILEARQAGYYVQGHIPFKLQGFTWDPQNKRMKSVEGVNITLGLPVIRTSVDHGTAFDIAGQGIASPAALLLAIDYAVKMASKSGRFIK
jgi:4-hydroxy-L-threonine phosphate dehydrogenase PdxA